MNVMTNLYQSTLETTQFPVHIKHAIVRFQYSVKILVLHLFLFIEINTLSVVLLDLIKMK